jgi:hypothetical protein
MRRKVAFSLSKPISSSLLYFAKHDQMTVAGHFDLQTAQPGSLQLPSHFGGREGRQERIEKIAL